MRYYNAIRNLCIGFRSNSPIKFNIHNPHSSSFSSSSSSSSTHSKFHLHSILESVNIQSKSNSDESPDLVFQHISSIFYGGQADKSLDFEEKDAENELERILNTSVLGNIPQNTMSFQRKDVSRERKRKRMFKITQEYRFRRLIGSYSKILGTNATLELFDKVGRKPGVKEYNALVGICIGKAREAENEDIAIEEMGKVFHLFKLMREQGLKLEEQTYRPLLLYTVDMCMVEEFQFSCHVIKDESPSSIARLGYYEMMLWLKVNNEEKIQELCNYIAENDGDDTFDLRESYLLALCESERKENILEVLEITDIKKLSSVDSVANIFQALGRLLLEPVAEKLLLDFKTCNHEEDNITNFIASYAISIPDLSVEDCIKKFNDLHEKLEVLPSFSSYEKLILHSCALLKEHTLSDGELDQLLLLLEKLNDTSYWNNVCCKIILCCIWNKRLSSAIDLCKLFKDKLHSDELVMKVLYDKVFSLIDESESNHLNTCMELLSEMKDKLGLVPSQKCYDSLLVACADSNDSQNDE